MEPAQRLLDTALASARSAADEASALLRKAYASELKISRKTSHHDLVTDADVAAEKAVMKILSAALPGAGFLCEECGGSIPEEGFVWIIDPLDGTTNFAHHYPHFSVSIALARPSGDSAGFSPLVGVIAEPLTGSQYWAIVHGGSFHDGKRISVSGASSLSESLIAASLSAHSHRSEGDLKAFGAFLAQAQAVRMNGSTALGLCAAAEGSVEAYWSISMAMPWDVAAGMLIVSEAGGLARYLPGEGFKRNFTFTSCPGIAWEALSLLAQFEERAAALLEEAR